MNPILRFDEAIAQIAINSLNGIDDLEKAFWRRLMNEIIDEKNRIKKLKFAAKNAEEKI